MRESEYLERLEVLEGERDAINGRIKALEEEYISSAPFKVGDKVRLLNYPSRKYYIHSVFVGISKVMYKITLSNKDGSMPKGTGRYVQVHIKAEELAAGWE